MAIVVHLHSTCDSDTVHVHGPSPKGDCIGGFNPATALPASEVRLGFQSCPCPYSCRRDHRSSPRAHLRGYGGPTGSRRVSGRSSCQIGTRKLRLKVRVAHGSAGKVTVAKVGGRPGAHPRPEKSPFMILRPKCSRKLWVPSWIRSGPSPILFTAIADRLSSNDDSARSESRIDNTRLLHRCATVINPNPIA